MKENVLIIIALILFGACENPTEPLSIPSPDAPKYLANLKEVDAKVYQDKVLGAIVGAAIGDAMGASTEMWHRSDIQKQYGYITALTPALRERSPEGTWQHNLPAGSTTDDTRWKWFMANYFSQQQNKLSADQFVRSIVNYYQNETKVLGEKPTLTSTDSLDVQIEKINWIKEWARVALAYQEGPKEYQIALHRFYGGEMSCAGMLYTPMFGLISENPDQAYKMAFDHALFDLGYARDISSLLASMTHVAMQTSDMDSILNTVWFVDPYGYNDSRLIGRLADANVKDVRQFVERSVLEIKNDTSEIILPANFPYSEEEWRQQLFLFEQLESRQKDIAFHAGEIWQILITGLAYGEGDFEKTMQFVVNYGRDNDTVAAIAGLILGASIGYEGLPKHLKEDVIKVHQKHIGIDLEAVAILIYKNRLAISN